MYYAGSVKSSLDRNDIAQKELILPFILLEIYNPSYFPALKSIAHLFFRLRAGPLSPGLWTHMTCASHVSWRASMSAGNQPLLVQMFLFDVDWDKSLKRVWKGAKSRGNILKFNFELTLGTSISILTPVVLIYQYIVEETCCFLLTAKAFPFNKVLLSEPRKSWFMGRLTGGLHRTTTSENWVCVGSTLNKTLVKMVWVFTVYSVLSFVITPS